MSLFRQIFLLLLATVVPLKAQNIHSWVDENGVQHFSDAPPSGEIQNQITFSIKQPVQRSFDSHRLYLVKEGYGYCGSQRLSVSRSDDPRQRLIDFLLAQKDTTVKKQNLKRELHQLGKTTTAARASKTAIRLEESIEECDCLLAWMSHELEILEEVKDQIVKEARQAEYRHAEAQKSCGPEPAPDLFNDPAAISWVKCTQNNMQLRNNLLKEKKAAQSREEAMIRGMQ